MKKLLLVLGLALALSGCSGPLQKAGVEIITKPAAKVFIDGKEAGMTPYKNVSLMPKIITVKLVFDKGEWQKDIRLERNVTTVIDWRYENESSGYILNLENAGGKEKAGLLVNGDPDKSTVAVDGEVVGYSPLKIDNIGAGDKQIKISFPGYGNKVLFVKAIAGYRLVVEAKLEREKTPNPVATPTKEVTVEKEKTRVMIKPTETGWLRVRELPNTGGKEKERVLPGQTFELIKREGDWLQIKLTNGELGWVVASYVDFDEQEN
jgi:hypothetical protein